jgi:hypothetical protein
VDHRSSLKRHWLKLTVFRPAANSSVAFRPVLLRWISVTEKIAWVRRVGANRLHKCSSGSVGLGQFSAKLQSALGQV